MLGGGIPLFGNAVVQVIEVRAVSIHGDMYHDAVVRLVPVDELEEELGGDSIEDLQEDELVDSEEGVESNSEGLDDPDAVRVGEWTIRQPSYQLRIPQHLCERDPKPGDLLNILFIAQQASEVEFLTD